MLLLSKEELKKLALETGLLDEVIDEFLRKLRLALQDLVLKNEEIRILELWLQGKSFQEIGEEYVKIYGRKRPYSRRGNLDATRPYNSIWIRERLYRIVGKIRRRLKEKEKVELKKGEGK